MISQVDVFHILLSPDGLSRKSDLLYCTIWFAGKRSKKGEMSLRRINLNLLPVLQALLQERSISRAADIVGMSQSAASDALMRLRHAFGDPLLVRVGSRMELTARAIELMPSLETICGHLEDFVRERKFDPLTAERTFTISTSDYVMFLIAGPLLATLEAQAPTVSLRFVNETDGLPEQLAARNIDLAIMPSIFAEELAPAQLNFQMLIQEVAVALFRTGHPLSHKDVLSVEDLLPYRTLLYHPGYLSVERRHADLFMGGQRFDVAADLTDLTLIPYMLVETDYFSLAPRRLAEWMTRVLPLQVRQLSFAQTPFDIGLAWGPVQDNDPGHRWFRNLILKCVQNMEVGPVL